ncbi:hypothetical protein BC835DRAFT_1306285 [Cytidiella melzeri]|nr:hypothetical protein BC835DRAFT_1306285 [Cytidiella melzeri]
MHSTAHDLVILATDCCVNVLGLTPASGLFERAVAVSVATIGRDWGFTQKDPQWSLNIYARSVFLAGSLGPSIGSVAAAFAPNAPTLIIFNGIIGIGSGPANGRVFAVLGAGQPNGYYIFGLILGGILCDTSTSGRTIFWLQAGLAVLLCVVGSFALPSDNKSRRYSQGLDWVGAILSTSGLALLVYDLA